MFVIPFVDLVAQYKTIEAEVREAIDSVLSASVFTLGLPVEHFENHFAAYCQAEHCAGVSSGTAALHLALRALNVGPGDEVITTTHTFIATAWAVSYVGAHPVLVDITPGTYTIDPRAIEQAITPRTKAIIPVHIHGHPAEMGPILDLAEQHGLYVIEDAAQAHGAEYLGRRCGSLGHVGCFSFYPSKNLGAYGDAGAVVTDDAETDARIRQLRDQGQCRKYIHPEIGYNYRMDTLQAAVLDVKLRHLDNWKEGRRRVAELYGQQLIGLSGIRTPDEAEYARHVFHHYEIQLPTRGARDSLQQHLWVEGVETGLHYPVPVHLQSAYVGLNYQVGDFPEAEKAAQCKLSLPLYPEMPNEYVYRVASCIARWAGV